MYRRGDVWLAALDPVIGSEQGKTRPVVIIQNNVANEHSPVVIIAAVTTTRGVKEYPTEIWVSPPNGGVRRASVVLLNQIRTIDKRRLIHRWGALDASTMKKLDEALMISVGLVPI